MKKKAIKLKNITHQRLGTADFRQTTYLTTLFTIQNSWDAKYRLWKTSLNDGNVQKIIIT